MELNIKIEEYSYNCGAGCCLNYGTITTINGVELPCHNQDTETIIKQSGVPKSTFHRKLHKGEKINNKLYEFSND